MNTVEDELIESLGFADGVRVGRDETGLLYLVGLGWAKLGKSTPELVRILKKLAANRFPGDGELPPVVRDLRDKGWLCSTVTYTGVPLITERLLPAVHGKAWDTDPHEVALSRFAVLRRDSAGLVVESPLADRVVGLCSPAVAALISRLATPTAFPLSDGELTGEVANALVRRLGAAGLVVAQCDDLRGARWGAHELWFHARSRWGGRSWPDPVGPVAAAGVSASQSDAVTGLLISLHRPDLAEVSRRDPPVTAVMESRKSIREHDSANPITVEQLGEFLYRCARVRSTMTYQGEQHTSRPYPSGGTVYELELYLAVHEVCGLAAGIFRYDPHEHVLCRLDASADSLLDGASVATLMRARPQVLILLAARFDEMLRRYRGMGYATTLKNVGVLYQTMRFMQNLNYFQSGVSQGSLSRKLATRRMK